MHAVKFRLSIELDLQMYLADIETSDYAEVSMACMCSNKVVSMLLVVSVPIPNLI
jgi:hypothetical protein